MEGVFSLTQRDVLTCKVSNNLFFFFTFFTCFTILFILSLKMHIQMIGLIKLYCKLDLFSSLSRDFVINGMNDGTFWKNSHGIWN